MTPLDYFCNELDDYIHNLMEDGMSWDEAVAEAMFEYDDFWAECKRTLP